MTKIGFVSLGCSKNTVDTEVMLHRLMTAGYEITPEPTEADIVVVNTCAFIESAKQESIDNILDIAYLKEHHTLRGIVVCGCLGERYGAQICRWRPGRFSRNTLPSTLRPSGPSGGCGISRK